jgi:N-acetylmuramate 1-kinase
VSREDQIQTFLKGCGQGSASWRPLADDASFRRYFRVNAVRPLVLMDAPPDKEKIQPFIAIGDYLNERGFSSPRIHEVDLENGFLLLEDLGDDTFGSLIKERRPPDEPTLYGAAVDVLLALHKQTPQRDLPVREVGSFTLPNYQVDEMVTAVQLLTEWYLPARTGRSVPASAVLEFAGLWRDALGAVDWGDPVLVHRDYHGDNLMWLPRHEPIANVGLIDFQDAAIGAAAYDLASLLQCCRRKVADPHQSTLLEHYLAQRPELDRGSFIETYTVLGAQRCTRIIGIFTRLWRRDSKPHYLTMIPTLWRQLGHNLDHPTLESLKGWYDEYCPADTRFSPLPAQPEALN